MTSRPIKKLSWFLAFGATMFVATATRGDPSPVTFYTSKGAFDAATGTTLLEDFEGFSPKDTVLASFISQDVTYTGFAGTPTPNVYVIGPGAVGVFGAGVPTPTTTSILTANGDEDFTAAFPTALSALGFDTYLNGLGPTTISVFNGGSLLDSFIYGGVVNTKEYLGIASTVPITSIRVTSTAGALLDVGIDNISIAAIPEPAQTASALAGMLLSVALVQRRRENSRIR